MLRLGVTGDIDLAPLFFPIEAGWAATPAGMTTSYGTLAELETRLLAGELDFAPITPLTYARNQSQLLLLPFPVRAFDIAADSVFLISNKRLDKYDKPRVAVAPGSAVGEAILKIIGRSFYSFDPQIVNVTTDVAALDALRSGADICIISGETGMRAVGPAKGRGYFVEDLSKAWWLLYEMTLPLILIGVSKAWTEQEPEATALARATIQMFRSAVQSAKEQMDTLADRVEKRTGLPAEALANHYADQRYELNSIHLRGLLEFYRRAAGLNLIPPVEDLNFYPPLGSTAPAPPAPPRRTITERQMELISEGKSEGKATSRPRPNTPAAAKNKRDRAAAQGLRVIKGGKDNDAKDENEAGDEGEE